MKTTKTKIITKTIEIEICKNCQTEHKIENNRSNIYKCIVCKNNYCNRCGKYYYEDQLIFNLYENILSDNHDIYHDIDHEACKVINEINKKLKLTKNDVICEICFNKVLNAPYKKLEAEYIKYEKSINSLNDKTLKNTITIFNKLKDNLIISAKKK